VVNLLSLLFQNHQPHSIHNYSFKTFVSNHNSQIRDHMTSKTMKLILTGTTGFVGQEVLTQALAHPSITSVVALTRHPIPATFASNPKVKNVLVEDFSTYTPSVLEQLSGADACVWYVYLHSHCWDTGMGY
jgi:hypothetical protein